MVTLKILKNKYFEKLIFFKGFFRIITYVLRYLMILSSTLDLWYEKIDPKSWPCQLRLGNCTPPRHPWVRREMPPRRRRGPEIGGRTAFGNHCVDSRLSRSQLEPCLGLGFAVEKNMCREVVYSRTLRERLTLFWNTLGKARPRTLLVVALD